MDNHNTWHPDPPDSPAVYSTTPDDGGRIFLIDGPGIPEDRQFHEYSLWDSTFWCYVTYKGRIPGPLGYGISLPWQVRLEKDGQGNPYAVNWGDYAE